jgi:hypothetical protein
MISSLPSHISTIIAPVDTSLNSWNEASGPA